MSKLKRVIFHDNITEIGELAMKYDSFQAVNTFKCPFFNNRSVRMNNNSCCMPIFNSSTCVDMNYVIGIWIILFNFLRLLSSYSPAEYPYEVKQEKWRATHLLMNLKSKTSITAVPRLALSFVEKMEDLLLLNILKESLLRYSKVASLPSSPRKRARGREQLL